MTEKHTLYIVGNVYTNIFSKRPLKLDGDPPPPYGNKPGPLRSSGTIIKFPKKENKKYLI